ncbi:hypothetical protein BDV97DRAFT_419198 [Delphinella strobiligena]|nr:hypothetical protein BDV97DRAFT_419198 [Delphinella strobiligena]
MTPIHPRSDTSLILVEEPRGRDSLYSGQIIFAIHTSTPWSNEPHCVDEDLSNLSWTKYGWIHSKMRPMIVLTTHAQHMVVIPLRSFNNRGVSSLNDTPDVKKEYIPVKSEGQISNIDLEGQDYLKLVRPFRKTTDGCICMTEVHSIDYPQERC